MNKDLNLKSLNILIRSQKFPLTIYVLLQIPEYYLSKTGFHSDKNINLFKNSFEYVGILFSIVKLIFYLT